MNSYRTKTSASLTGIKALDTACREKQTVIAAFPELLHFKTGQYRPA